MQTTSLTLLERVRQPNDQSAWERFVSLYSPLLFAFARRAGMNDNDAADVVQDVFLVLMDELPGFEYDAARKNFRGWLKTITVHKCRERQRRRGIA
ncbi:MAG: sigma-70 family RNA polymerase sigma factor, partial [Planctomycetaceae bacterium]|nr:sigma-70 family RNA polymerase sigma factor [Planctomycetaceae bacterium]